MEQMIASWSMVMVHGLMVAGPSLVPNLTRSWGRGKPTSRGALRDNKSNVVHVQAGYLARPVTEAPETQIYFITHGSGANSVPRVRTVVRGERASRSIVNRTTALWSIWMVASLILAGYLLRAVFPNVGRGVAESRGSNGAPKIAQCNRSRRARWTLPLTNGRKRT